MLLNINGCDGSGFADQFCAAQQRAAAKYPDYSIVLGDVDGGSSCLSLMAVNGSNYRLVIMLSFALEDCAVRSAPANPTTWIVLLDGCPMSAANYPNLLCGVFGADQPSYTAGYLAGLLSSSKVTGIVGGVPLKAVQQLFNGFLLGVLTSCPDCRVEGMYVNSFFHPGNAASVATYLVNSTGADVVYGCGGGTGSLAIQRAAELGSLVVGVDVDEFETTFGNLPPKVRARIVTSVLKRVDVATLIVIDLLISRQPGESVPGLVGSSILFDYANGGVGLADCHFSCRSIPQDTWTAVRQQENLLSSRTISTGLGGQVYQVPLLPSGAEKNVFHVAPNPAKPPAARFQAAMTSLNAGGFLDFVVVFGGKSAEGDVLGDLWLYNVQSGMWLDSMHGMTTGVQPPPLAKACAVTLGETVFIFGGRTASGDQSKDVYGFTYQPSFLGFGDPSSPLIRHEWSHYAATGSEPLPVEGPSCTPLNTTCGIVFGGRARLQDVNTMHLFCLEGGRIHWTQLFDPSAGSGPAPAARESAGVAVVNATAVGLGLGDALVAVGGVSAGVESAEVWAMMLDRRDSWSKIADLPHPLMAPLVFSAKMGDAHVLIVQPSSRQPNSAFGAFTYDASAAVWNTQTMSFRDAGKEETRQASMVRSAGRLWAFGGTVAGAYQDDLLALDFQLQIKCEPGTELFGLGCRDCPPGNFSLGGTRVRCQSCAVGTYAASSGTSLCMDCPAGRYSYNTGRSECEVCPVGRFKEVGNQPCQGCPAGSYNPANGSTSASDCMVCPAGTYANGTAHVSVQSCIPCERGRALSNAIFETACKKCEPGTFAKDRGQPVCQPCPKGEVQPSKERASCIACSRHLAGSTTEVLGATHAQQCLCQAGSFRTDNASAACETCVGGMDCAVGSDMRHYYAVRDGSPAPPGPVAYPLLRPHYWSAADNPLHVFKCKNDQVCPGGQPGTCGNAQTYGRACNMCEKGYFSAWSACLPCTDIEMSAVIFPLVPLVGIAIIICALYRMFKDLPDKWGSWRNMTSTLFFLLLRFYQTVSLLKETDLGFSSVASQGISYSGIALDVISVINIQCAGLSTFQSAIMVHNLVPAIVFFEGAVIYAVMELVARFSQKPRGMDKDNLINILFSLLYSFFTGIVNASLSLFRCQSNPAEEMTLVKYPEVICYSEDWSAGLGICIPALLIYCIGSLLLFARTVQIAPQQFRHVWFQKRWKFLFIKYRPDVHWWSFVVLFQGITINFATVLFSTSSEQLTWLTVCQMLYLALLFIFMPWRWQAANVMDMITQICSIMVFYVSSWTLNPNLPENYDAHFYLALLLPFIALPLVGMAYVIPRIRLSRQGHHSGITDDMMDTIQTVAEMYSILDRQNQQIVLEAIGEHDVKAMIVASTAIWAELEPRKSRRLVVGRLRNTLMRALSTNVGQELHIEGDHGTADIREHIQRATARGRVSASSRAPAGAGGQEVAEGNCAHARKDRALDELLSRGPYPHVFL